MDHQLAKWTSGKSPSSLISRLVPPEYLYRKAQIRDVRRKDIAFSLNMSHVVDHFIYFDFLDPAFNNLMDIVEKDFVIIDVGANIGRFSFHFAKKAIDGKVYCFEPDPYNFSMQMHNASRNNFNNIKFHQMGLGSESGSFPLYRVNLNNPGMNRILLHGHHVTNKVEIIDVASLDEIMPASDTNKLDLIKIDVEGFEFEVLRGGENLIDKFKPILFIELSNANLSEHNSSSKEVVEWIQSKGYFITDASSNQPVFDNIPQDQIDILCQPHSS